MGDWIGFAGLPRVHRDRLYNEFRAMRYVAWKGGDIVVINSEDIALTVDVLNHLHIPRLPKFGAVRFTDDEIAQLERELSTGERADATDEGGAQRANEIRAGIRREGKGLLLREGEQKQEVRKDDG